MMPPGRGRGIVRVACTVLGSVFLFAACAAQPQAAVVSLCEVVKEFGRYRDQLVVLQASIRSDAHHESSLQDVACPRYGAQLSYSDIALANGSAQRLREAIFAEPPGTLRKSIDVTVTGRLTRKPPDAGGLFVFVADSITGISVTVKSKSE